MLLLMLMSRERPRKGKLVIALKLMSKERSSKGELVIALELRSRERPRKEGRACDNAGTDFKGTADEGRA